MDVQCMQYSLSKRQSERMEARACGDLAKPQTREPCHGDCLLKSWQYSAWSQVGSTAKHVVSKPKVLYVISLIPNAMFYPLINTQSGCLGSALRRVAGGLGPGTLTA